MKQHITEEQLDELTPKQRASFNKWIGFPEGMTGHKRETIRLITIGQMIEFLMENNKYEEYTIKLNPNTVRTMPIHHNLHEPFWLAVGEAGEYNGYHELCDALWSACKEALNG